MVDLFRIKVAFSEFNVVSFRSIWRAVFVMYRGAPVMNTVVTDWKSRQPIPSESKHVSDWKTVDRYFSFYRF